MPKIDQSKILIMSTDGFEQSELEVPLNKLKDAGAEVHVASQDGQPITGWSAKDWGDQVEANYKISDINVGDYDAIVLPGGQINPDVLRVDETAVSLVRSFAENNKVVAAICHAPWLLIEAGVIDGRDATSYKSIRTDMENAGAKWQDEAVVVDNGVITSRSPDDLDSFVSKIIEEVEEGEHQRRVA